MAGKAQAALRRLAGLGLTLLAVAFVGMCVATSINYSALGLPGFGNDAPKVDQALLNKAADSAAGRDLKRQGFTPKATIDDKDMASWLTEQEKHDKVTNPGPFVVFSLGLPQAADPTPAAASDIVVDATNGVMVARSQSYSNGRGAACYNSGDMRVLGSVWVDLNLYLWQKGLESSYEVTKEQVPSLAAAGLAPVHCFTFVP